MPGLIRKSLAAAAAAALLAGAIARADTDSAQFDALQKRLTATEQRLDTVLGQLEDLQRQMGQQPARDPVNRDEVAQIVKEEMQKARKPTDLNVYWDKGLHLDSQDGAFKLKIGGRLQTDFASIKGDSAIENAVGPLTDGTEVRRLYLAFSGSIYDNTDYAIELDFAAAKVQINNAYLQFSKVLPLGAALRVGQFKEPINMENVTSDIYTTFMERSLATALVPTYDKGIAVVDTFANKRGTVAAGVFWATTNGTAQLDSGRALTARVTYLPWYADDGAKLLHVGAAIREVSTGTVQYTARPEMHLAPNFLDTGQIQSTGVAQAGLETALVYGPASVQAEYIRSSVSQQNGPDLDYSGYYVEGSYFLTGEHRNYDTGSATWGAVSPKHNFDGKGGMGAWQLAARYSHLDLSDPGAVLLPINGKPQTPKPGSLSDITLGLNWYLNPNVRVMLNYVHALLDNNTEGSANGVMMRFQVFF
jgi:phosphate-selective porin OprO/OprP